MSDLRLSKLLNKTLKYEKTNSSGSLILFKCDSDNHNILISFKAENGTSFEGEFINGIVYIKKMESLVSPIFYNSTLHAYILVSFNGTCAITLKINNGLVYEDSILTGVATGNEIMTGLSDIKKNYALTSDIPTFKTINGNTITGSGNIVISFDDTDYVKLSGEQTITGKKIFNSEVQIRKLNDSENSVGKFLQSSSSGPIWTDVSIPSLDEYVSETDFERTAINGKTLVLGEDNTISTSISDKTTYEFESTTGTLNITTAEVTGGNIADVDLTGGNAGSILISSGNGTNPSWLDVGSNGQVLVSRPGVTSKLSWEDFSGSGASVNLNGSDTSSASFYAPLTSGTSGWVLTSTGLNSAPVWNTSLNIHTLTITSSAALPSGDNITINGTTLPKYIESFVSTDSGPDSGGTDNEDPDGCLAEDTLIMMADGTEKRVADVQVGDEVLSYDLKSDTFTTSVVLFNRPTEKKLYAMNYFFDDGTILRTDWTHDFYDLTKKTWVNAHDELELDDQLMKIDKSTTDFIGEKWAPDAQGRYQRYYNIIVSNCCYFANKILLSNNPYLLLHWNRFYGEKLNVNDNIKSFISSINLCTDSEQELLNNDETLMIQYLKNNKVIRKNKKSMEDLKVKLQNTDYVTLKMAEGIEIDQQIIDNRAEWRKQFNEIESINEKLIEENYWLIKENTIAAEKIDIGEYERRSLNLFACNSNANKILEDFKALYNN